MTHRLSMFHCFRPLQLGDSLSSFASPLLKTIKQRKQTGCWRSSKDTTMTTTDKTIKHFLFTPIQNLQSNLYVFLERILEASKCTRKTLVFILWKPQVVILINFWCHSVKKPSIKIKFRVSPYFSKALKSYFNFLIGVIEYIGVLQRGAIVRCIKCFCTAWVNFVLWFFLTKSSGAEVMVGCRRLICDVGDTRIIFFSGNFVWYCETWFHTSVTQMPIVLGKKWI